jgi:hypothetical protein
MKLEELNQDTLFEVLTYLEREEIIKLRKTNKKIKNKIENEQLWRILCQRDKYNLNKLSPNCSFKQFYFHYEDQIKNNKEMGAEWLIKFDSKNLKWEENRDLLKLIENVHNKKFKIITILNLEGEEDQTGHIIKNILKIEDTSVFPKEKDILTPSLYCWNKPIVDNNNSNILVLKPYCLFESQNNFFENEEEQVNIKKGIYKK